MNVIRNLTIGKKLSFLTVFLLTLILFSSWFSKSIVDRVKVTGPVYSEIVSRKDLLADILPPPMYIIEAYLTTHAAADMSDAAEREKLIQKLSVLKKDYVTRVEYWQKSLPEGELRKMLQGESHQQADAFFEVVDSKLIPLLRAGDLAGSRELLDRELRNTYEAHREALTAVVDGTQKDAATLERDTATELSATQTKLFVMTGVLCLIIVVTFWFAGRSTTARLFAARKLAQQLAAGQFKQRLDVVGGDELDQMSAELSSASASLDAGFSQMIESMDCAAKRDYSKVITQSLPGELERGKASLNTMLGTLNELAAESRENRALADAVGKSQAVIEFGADGTILNANANFLTTMGYSLDEIKGRHHSIFVDPAEVNSPAYREFWTKLASGQFDSAEYKRIGKGGREVWLQASYNPIVDLHGRTYKVVKYATDITSTKLKNADHEGQLAAISRSQAVIEFDLKGTVLNANENFLNSVGYSLHEIVGRQHSLFVDPGYASHADYRQFWADLAAGQFRSGEYRRVGKNGKEIWIQASYNPILDVNGKPCKVVKYANDITEAKKLELQLADQKRKTEEDERLRNERDRQIALEQQDKVQTILEVCKAIAAGDFTAEVPDLGNDSIGQVSTALGSAVNAIKETLLEVRTVAETVASAASQLNSASTEISKGAQHQASSLEETASSLEEITSTVKQNTDNAQQARQLANGSRDVADRGGSVVEEAVKAMGEINQSSTRIADIITTIDEIAFQTNLLALNAAVEAARAGEQGRGFAVVAAEVRNLAQRSASAAKEIKSLIQDSVRKVENGTDLVNRSGKTLEEIVGSVKRVTDIVAEIAAASKEQLTGIEQVNKAVSQMDRVTQNNASQTEEMNGTAASLLQHAEQLSEAVARFRLSEEVQTPNRNAKKTTRASKTSVSTRNTGAKKNAARMESISLDSVTDRLEQLVTTGFQEF
jgi:methyl-accepting chemotaxis protein